MLNNLRKPNQIKIIYNSNKLFYINLIFNSDLKQGFHRIPQLPPIAEVNQKRKKEWRSCAYICRN